MLSLSFLEIVCRVLPESLIILFGMYTFSRTEFNMKNYVNSSIVLVICIYIIRKLPINFGVHTILNILILVVISHILNNIDVISSVKIAIKLSILQFFSEGLNILFIKNILNKNIVYIFNDSYMKVMYGLPSLVIFIALISLIRYGFGRESGEF